MMLALRPMKAHKLASLSQLTFPTWANPKFDGIRAVSCDGHAMSCSWKLLRNNHVQELFASLPPHLDGELVTSLHFHDTQSDVMSEDGRPDVQYMVFDYREDPNLPYSDRIARLQTLSLPDYCVKVFPTPIFSLEHAKRFEEQVLEAGHEGLVFKDPNAPYHFGRCRHILKWKHFLDSEARIVGFQEARQNINPQVPNAYGLMRRPGGGPKLPKGTLGSFDCVDIHTGVAFSCGTGKGLTADLRQHIWDNQAAYIGRVFTYRHLAVGVREKPRVPSWQGWRDEGE